MRTFYFLLMIICIFLVNIPMSTASADVPESQLIQEYDEDLTGDNIKEKIILKGIPFTENTAYYRDIWIEITGLHGNEWRVSFEGGYHPSIQFIDLNQDGILDIFFESSTEANGNTKRYRFYTLKNNQVKSIPLPVQYYLKGRFIDHYQVEIKISPDQQPIIIDLNHQMNQLQNLNLYDHQGNILKRKPVMINPISYFEPVLMSGNKGYGLKSYQQIYGLSYDQPLGTVETLWYYNHDQWIILRTEWKAK